MKTSNIERGAVPEAGAPGAGIERGAVPEAGAPGAGVRWVALVVIVAALVASCPTGVKASSFELKVGTNSITFTPISEYPRTNTVGDGMVFLLGWPGQTNLGITKQDLFLALASDPVVQSTLATNYNFLYAVGSNLVVAGFTNLTGPAGPTGPAGTPGSNGINGTSWLQQPAATWTGPMNSLNLSNIYWFYSAAGNGYLTNVIWSATNYIGTLVISNTQSTNITFALTPAGQLYGAASTNLLNIPAHKQAIVSVLVLGGINFVTANQQ